MKYRFNSPFERVNIMACGVANFLRNGHREERHREKMRIKKKKIEHYISNKNVKKFTFSRL
jgi:hypothetical protein